MSLQPGTSLGPYQIDAPLGAGGMGEVYRARDTTLDRDVAIKVLPDAFASAAWSGSSARRKSSSLNHPNIAQIHGLSSRPPSPTTWISEELQKCSPPSRTGVSRLPTSGGSSDRWCRGVGLLLCNPKRG